MTNTFTPGSAAVPTAEVELTLSCRGLKSKDFLSKSDPLCVTFVQPFGEKRWVEYHRTECIPNCHDPDFVSKVNIPYRFEEQQRLKFEVYDIDSSSTNLGDHDFLGSIECNLSQIISSGYVKLALSSVKNSTGDGSDGHLLVQAEELSTLKDEIILQFSGKKLDKKDWFGKSDPFLVFHKSTEANSYTVVHQTEVIKRTLNPNWKRFTIPIASICNGDWDRNLKVVCWDWNSSGNNSLIGEFYATLRELKEAAFDNRLFPLVHPDKKKDGKYRNSGEIKVDYFEQHAVSSFLDYIRGGTELHCSIAIDFTGSNGNPASPDSLHYISNVPNLYEQAIISVGRIIQDYDSDKQFPVLGFGARLPPDGHVSHEFFVNMDPSNPYCSGINAAGISGQRVIPAADKLAKRLESFQNRRGKMLKNKISIRSVLQAYRACIRQVQLYGPTNFAPIINHVARFASCYRTGTHYFILLILTDGIITDMPQTVQNFLLPPSYPLSNPPLAKTIESLVLSVMSHPGTRPATVFNRRAIVKASTLPYSIIIVGVGNADFTAMETLDADTVALETGGMKAQRDIVQFVPFNKFLSIGDPTTARNRLAREVLAEIPKQFLSYMRMNNISAKPPQSNLTTLPPDPEIILMGP